MCRNWPQQDLDINITCIRNMLDLGFDLNQWTHIWKQKSAIVIDVTLTCMDLVTLNLDVTLHVPLGVSFAIFSKWNNS